LCETSTVKNKTFNLQWNIKDYKTVLQNHPEGKYLTSQKFSVSVNGIGVNFWLKLYPNGEDEEENNGLFLNSDDVPEDCENLKVSPVFSIIDSSGKKFNENVNDETGLPYREGFANYFDDDLLAPESGLLKDGTLTILCEITLKFGDVVCKKIKDTNIVEEDTSHAEDMMKMLVNAEDYEANMQIVCKDGIIPVHSSVLSARSEYFQAMLSHDMEERRTGKILKEHLYKSLVLTILEFIYTGKVDPTKISLQLLEESNEMRLIELKQICCKHLSKEVNMTNCVAMLISGDRINAINLKEAAKELIMENYADLPSKSKKELESVPSLLTEICSDFYQNTLPTKRQRVE